MKPDGLVAVAWLAMVQVVVALPPCNPPSGAKLWHANPGQIVHDVVWGYQNVTYTPRDSSENFNATDDSVPVQLPTVEMQLGSILRFIPSHHQGIPFTMKSVMVDEAGFLTCNTSHAQEIMTSETNETFEIDAHFLTPGTHYFILDPSSHNSLFECDMGLRVKVVVKPNACGSEGQQDATCGGQGICATFQDDPTYKCLCCGTYEGAACGVFNPCLSNPCGRGGECVQDAPGSEKFTCECSIEFYGERCQHKRQNQCDAIECQNNGTCTGNSTYFVCECPDGLTGTHCEVDVNDCSPSPCENGACVDERGGFRCQCKPGFYGKTCSEQKQSCSLNPCKNGGFCHDTTTNAGFRFQCHCLPGWTGKDCTSKINACEPDTCSHHGYCREDDETGFRCSCPNGYTGTRCEININDCSPNPCRYGGHCKDGINSHTCICINSHIGSNCQFVMDLFSPVLEGPGSAGGLSREHARNLYIVAGILAFIVVTVVVVLIACFCRISGAYRQCWCCWWNFNAWMHYRKHRDSLVVGVDVSSANDCPLAVDAFYRPDGLDPDVDAYSRSYHGAFENQTV